VRAAWHIFDDGGVKLVNATVQVDKGTRGCGA
jgi:hypothetical protein